MSMIEFLEHLRRTGSVYIMSQTESTLGYRFAGSCDSVDWDSCERKGSSWGDLSAVLQLPAERRGEARQSHLGGHRAR